MRKKINTIFNLFSASTLKIKSIILFLLIIVFIIFRLVSWRDRINTAKSLSGILRSEYLNANSYALSKALSDLELLKIATCIKLTEQSAINRVYYDTSNNPYCIQNSALKYFFEISSELVAINGLIYEINFQLPISWSLVFLEVFSYIFVLVLFIFYIQKVNRENTNNALKIKTIELEKEMMLEINQQIKHDIASPITALKTIVNVLNNVDPEIKDFLARAVERTEEIFTSLSKASENKHISVTFFDLHSCIEEIVSEKKVLWGNFDRIYFFNNATSKNLALGNDTDMKRILSNILQNAFEALSFKMNDGHIDIVLKEISDYYVLTITDNGMGMSEQTLSKLGTKGFSIGKQGYQNSGSGLGVYHAITTVKSWGGSLVFSSEISQGTTATLKIRSNTFN